MDEWRRLLRDARTRLRMSRPELAEATLKAYESGVRHPRRPYLVAILDALKIDRGTRNDVLASAGFVPDGAGLRYDMRDLAFTVDEAAIEMERYGWPAFLGDEFGRVLAANSVARRIWGVDLEREFPDPMDRHLLSVAAMPRFADRCLNWDEAVGTILATWRNHFRGAESFDAPSPLFAGIVERLLEGDPKYVSRLAELWRDAPPIKVKMRWSYRIVWQVPGFDMMRFQGFLSAANEPDGYMFYDWIPVDATTWEQLNRLKAAVGSDDGASPADA